MRYYRPPGTTGTTTAMDAASADLAWQAILGRGTDFVGGIDNEALDFSQLEAFINSSEAAPGVTATYFSESLNAANAAAVATAAAANGTTAAAAAAAVLSGIHQNGKQIQNNMLVVGQKRQPGVHPLPDSPPDSSSEHPYSPSDTSDHLPSTTSLINPLLSDTTGGTTLILGSHIVVSADPTEPPQYLIDDACGILPGEAQQVPQLVEDYVGAGGVGYVDHVQQAQRVVMVKAPCSEAGDDSGGGTGVVYTSLQSVVTPASKKRKLSQDLIVKNEPENCSPSQLSPPDINDEEYAASESCLSESQYQCIRFQAFQQNTWHTICDQNLAELTTPHYRVDADKGFNFSNSDDAFVCQKKNHFQITAHVQILGDVHFVKTTEGLQKISSFHLHFYGVKHDCPSQTIRVEQSQSDRSKKPFHPVLVELVNSQVTKVTVGRLHFSETTSNNMRKKGKPNPEQRYFQLVVGLHAHTPDGNFPIVSHASQKIIVRASNPGQFESDVELCWQKGQTQDSIFHGGKVGVNTDRPDESLVVHGNIKITGHIIQPSDIRAKKNITECNTADQLRNVQKLRVVRYDYAPEFAQQLNRPDAESDTGVIAQEVAEILPEAVSSAGDLTLTDGTKIDNFLVVNKERIFMENIGAVKELCRVTDNLENRIDQLERINKRLTKLKRGDSLKSNSTVSSAKLTPASSKKCMKNHQCNAHDDELCSNKFIQIIIVVLVLIMAFCLMAITTLYLVETSRHNQFAQANLQQVQMQAFTTVGPSKLPKIPTWSTNIQDVQTLVRFRDPGAIRTTLDTTALRKSAPVIGRPSDCTGLDQELENTNLCQIYCCLSPNLDANNELATSMFQSNQIEHNKNKTTLLTIDKNRIVKPFNTNNIDKQRQRRDADDWTDKDNNEFDQIEDQFFTIIIQGQDFNTTLTNKYLFSSNNNNYSYSVPISKYMPDDIINLLFRSLETNIKDIEHCYNEHEQSDCPNYPKENSFEDNKTTVSDRINENSPSGVQNSLHTVSFQVDMLNFQSRVMTYRASLRQTQNNCKLSPTKLGLEYAEYNFYFYRHCDE